MTHPFGSADISIIHRKSAIFAISENTDIDFFESLKIILINMVTILMMASKLATPGLLK